jgi:hypothetical protein
VPLIAGGAVAALALAGGAFYFMSGPKTTGDPLVDAQNIAARADCTWVKVDRESAANKLILTGAAGDVAGLTKAVSGAVSGMTVDSSGVAPIESTGCVLLDTLKPLQGGGVSLKPNQSRYELRQGGSQDTTKTGPSAEIELAADIGTGSNKFVMYDITQAGMIKARIMSSEDLADYVKAGSAEKVSDDRFKLKTDIDETGWRGLLLLTAASALPAESTDALKGTPTESALKTFANDAASAGWKADLAWVNFVDNDPN